MIKFDCVINDFNFQDQSILKYNEYPEMLLIEGDFKITINKELFFDEPYFPIIEFMKVVLPWMNTDETTPMLYNTVEAEENPLISFTKTIDGWNVFSPWQEYNCNLCFSKEELAAAIIELKQNLILKYPGFKELLG